MITLYFFYYPVLYEEAMPVMNGIEAVYSDTSTLMTDISNPTYGERSNTMF